MVKISETKKASKDVLIYTLVNVIPVFLGFISIPIYTRIFNPSEYGQLSIVQMTANYTMILMLSWLTSSFLRFYEFYKKKGQEEDFTVTYIITMALIIPLALATYTIFLVLAGFYDWFEPVLLQLFLIGAGLLFFNGFINFLQTYYRTRRKSAMFAVVSIANGLFTLLLGLFFVLSFDFGVNGILLGSTIASGIIATMGIMALFRTHDIRVHRFKRFMVKEAFIYGTPIIFTAIAGWALRFSDRYIIELTRGTAEVGLYSVAYNISEKTIMVFITALSLAIAPIIFSTWEHKGKMATEISIRTFARYQYMVLLPATAGLIVLAPEFMKIFVGPEFSGGAPATQVVAASIFFFGLYSMTNLGLYLEKRTVKIATTMMVVGGGNILLNITLVPIYGYIAAAVTTFFCYFCLWVISYFQTRRILRWSIPWVSVARITLSVFAMVLALYIFKTVFPSNTLTILTSIFVGAVVYLGVLLFSGEARAEYNIVTKYLLQKIRKGDTN